MADTEDTDVIESSELSEDMVQSHTSRRMSFHKRTQLTVADKKAIIDRIDNGEKQRKLAREYGTANSTISDIYKHRAKVEEFFSMSVSPLKLGRKKMRRANDEVLDKAVYNWFVYQVHKGVVVTGPMIMEYAKKMDQQINVDEGKFKATSGWLKCFKSRHGLKGLSLANSDDTVGDVFEISYKQALREYIESKNLKPEQVYSADESVLYWRCVPDKAMVNRVHQANKGILEDHITLLCCTNSTGEHKQKVMVIGQEQNPPCFAHVNPDNLPVIYRHHKNNMMNAVLFKEWFNHYFVPSVNTYMAQKGLPKQALLILDNCPSHWPKAPLTSGCGKVECMFLPNQAKAAVQPLQCGIVQMLKRNYRKSLLQTLLNEVDATKQIKVATASLSIKDAGYMILDSWLTVKQELIVNAWASALDLPPAPPDLSSTINVYEPFNDLVQLAAELQYDYDLNGTVESNIILAWLKIDEKVATEGERWESEDDGMCRVPKLSGQSEQLLSQMSPVLIDDNCSQVFQTQLIDLTSQTYSNRPVPTQTTHQTIQQLQDNVPAFNLPAQQPLVHINPADSTCSIRHTAGMEAGLSPVTPPVIAGETRKVPTEQEAIHHAEQLLFFLEAQSHIDPNTIIQLRGIRNLLKQRNAYTAKQRRMAQNRQEYYAI